MLRKTKILFSRFTKNIGLWGETVWLLFPLICANEWKWWRLNHKGHTKGQTLCIQLCRVNSTSVHECCWNKLKWSITLSFGATRTLLSSNEPHHKQQLTQETGANSVYLLQINFTMHLWNISPPCWAHRLHVDRLKLSESESRHAKASSLQSDTKQEQTAQSCRTLASSYWCKMLCKMEFKIKEERCCR